MYDISTVIKLRQIRGVGLATQVQAAQVTRRNSLRRFHDAEFHGAECVIQLHTHKQLVCHLLLIIVVGVTRRECYFINYTFSMSTSSYIYSSNVLESKSNEIN